MKWTPEEDARLHALRKSGYLMSEIAVVMGRSESACYHRNYAIERGPVTPAASWWTAAEKRKLAELWTAGKPDEEIAAAFPHRSPHAVRKMRLAECGPANRVPYEQYRQNNMPRPPEVKGKADWPEDMKFDDHPRPYLRGEYAVVLNRTPPSRFHTALSGT